MTLCSPVTLHMIFVSMLLKKNVSAAWIYLLPYLPPQAVSVQLLKPDIASEQLIY